MNELLLERFVSFLSSNNSNPFFYFVSCHMLGFYMTDQEYFSWTVIQWELYPIPSALGSQISSGLVSSTVGDHVRSPGTVRFAQHHFCSIHSHPYIYSSFYSHHIAHHLDLQHSLYHEILPLKQTHFQRNRSLPTFFTSDHSIIDHGMSESSRERLKALPRRCSVGHGTIRSFRRVQISVGRWNEIHQDLSHEEQSEGTDRISEGPNMIASGSKEVVQCSSSTSLSGSLLTLFSNWTPRTLHTSLRPENFEKSKIGIHKGKVVIKWIPWWLSWIQFDGSSSLFTLVLVDSLTREVKKGE